MTHTLPPWINDSSLFPWMDNFTHLWNWSDLFDRPTFPNYPTRRTVSTKEPIRYHNEDSGRVSGISLIRYLGYFIALVVCFSLLFFCGYFIYVCFLENKYQKGVEKRKENFQSYGQQIPAYQFQQTYDPKTLQTNAQPMPPLSAPPQKQMNSNQAFSSGQTNVDTSAMTSAQSTPRSDNTPYQTSPLQTNPALTRDQQNIQYLSPEKIHRDF